MNHQQQLQPVRIKRKSSLPTHRKVIRVRVTTMPILTPRGGATRRPLPATRETTREGVTTMPPTTAMISPALRERRRQ